MTIKSDFFVQCLDSAKHCSKKFTYISILNPHTKIMSALAVFPDYLDQGTEVYRIYAVFLMSHSSKLVDSSFKFKHYRC